MRVTLLGTGDAVGTPKVGCSCPICTHAVEAGLSRLRTSILIQNSGAALLIDTSPDLRSQLLNHGSPVIGAVCWTHGHYDHYSGFGEFYRVQRPPPAYAPHEILDYCAGFFDFLPFDKIPVNPGEATDILGIRVTFFPVNHPPVPTYGILCECEGASVGYTADTRADIPERSCRILTGVDLLLVDALVPAGVHIRKHMNYSEACNLAESVGAADFRCVHMSHTIPWELPHTGTDGEVFEL